MAGNITPGSSKVIFKHAAVLGIQNTVYIFVLNKIK